jgi:hypothetical protein
MENSIMNCQSVLDGNKRMDIFPNVEDGNLVVSKTKRGAKSECAKSDEHNLRERNGILDFFLKILLPKNITTTPPPDRQIYY